MSGLDYSRFDRIVSSVDAEDSSLEALRKKEHEAAVARDLKLRRDMELKALKQAEEEWLKARSTVELNASICPARDGPTASSVCSSTNRSQRVDATSKSTDGNASPDMQDTVKHMTVDDFFRDPTEEEKKKRAECKELTRQRQKKGGQNAVHAPELTSTQLEQYMLKLEADRFEMSLLMQQADRHAVKARLCEFLIDMDNELARLRQDPAELDDDDRRELRLFHLRKWQLPGAARSKIDFPSMTGSSPKPLECLQIAEGNEPWQPISLFAVDLGEANSSNVTIDVRIEAVERLPQEAVTCQFRHDAFDLKIVHELEGIRYRLLRSRLLRDIVPERCTFSVKRNHVVVTLAKRATETGRGTGHLPWTALCAEDSKSRNPPLEGCWTGKT